MVSREVYLAVGQVTSLHRLNPALQAAQDASIDEHFMDAALGHFGLQLWQHLQLCRGWLPDLIRLLILL